MKTIQKVESALDEISDYDFLFFTDKDTDIVLVVDDETLSDAASSWGVSEQMIKDLKFSFDTMRDEIISHLKTDLEDIWKKVSK